MNQIASKPALSINGLTFFPIPDFSKAVFGADVANFFDRRKIPDVPRKYEDIVENIFFVGGKLPDMQSSVNREKATLAMHAWLSSFAPAHEAKIGTAAYALWVWCEGELPAQ